MQPGFTVTRRELIGGLLGLGTLYSLPEAVFAESTLPVRNIPGTTEMLPVIGLGSTKPVRLIESEGPEPLESVMRMLLRYGGRLIDTAPRHEDLDARFGKVLQKPEFRDALFVAVKINAEGRDAGIAQFRQTQRLFGRQTLDLVQIESITDLATHWPTLRAWKESGDARYIGVTVARESLYAPLEKFMRDEQPDFVQLNYSVAEYTAEDRLLPLAADRGIAILVNGPFMNGEYFSRVRDLELPDWTAEFDCASWAQFSLKYILGHPAVTCVLTETTNPGHMRENIEAGFGRLPDAATKKRMRDLLEGV